MKKLLVFALSLALLISAFSMLSFAEDSASYSGNYVVFGDSIAAGYGLDESAHGSDEALAYVADRDSDAYAGIVARTLDFDLFNYAHSGDTTSDMLKVLGRSAVKKSIANADLITVSIGGNDLIDMASTVLFQAFMHQLGMSDTNDEIDAMYETLEKNLTEAMTTIVSLNNGRGTIMLQTLYNPFKYNSSYTFNGINAGDLIDSYINKINDIYKSICKKVGGFILTPTAEALNADERSFYTIDEKPDFHPTAHGHALIAETILASYRAENPSDDQTETTEVTQEYTEEPTEPTTEPTVSTEPTVYTTVEPSESIAETYEPTVESTSIVPDPTEPTTEPTESVAEPTEVSAEPTALSSDQESTESGPIETAESPDSSSKASSSKVTESTEKAQDGCSITISGSAAAIILIGASVCTILMKKSKND